MTFVPKNWEDLPAKNTPIDRESLQDLETRLANYGGEQQALNVKSYGAKGDGTQLLDGEMTLGGKELKTAHSFDTKDIGKEITVEGAGPGSKLPLVTTIESVSSGTATLTHAAEKAVSGKTVLFGTDDTEAIQSALDAAHELYLSTGSPQTLWFPSLSFLMSYAKGQVLEGVETCLEIKSGTIMQAEGAHLFTMPPAATVTTKAYEGEPAELKVASTRRFSETNNVLIVNDLKGELGFTWTSKTATSFTGTSEGSVGGKYPIGSIVGQSHNRTMISTPASTLAVEWKIKGFLLDGQTVGEGTETSFPEDAQHGVYVVYGGENFEIASNEIKGFTGKALFIDGEGETGRLTAFSIHHNYIHDCFGNAMRYSLATDFSITDNLIRNGLRNGDATAEALITTASLSTRGGRIADNLIDNWGTMDVSGSGMVIEGNYLRAGAERPGNALIVVAVSNNTVVANNVFDLGPALKNTIGLWLGPVGGGHINLTVTGNTFQGATGGSTTTDLLLLNAAAENLTIVGNTFTTPFAASVRLIGGEPKTNVVIADNVFDFKAANCSLSLATAKHASITDNILNGGVLEFEGEDGLVSGNVVNAFSPTGTALVCEGSATIAAENNIKGVKLVLAGAIAYDNMVDGVSEAVTIPYIEKLVASLGGESAYKTAVLEDSPVAYWRMDETAKAKDQTANKNEGVLHGAIPLAAGALGRSADFDKANGYTNNAANFFSVVDNASLHLTAELTVECWVYFNVLTGNCSIFEKSVGGVIDTSYVLVTVGSKLLARVIKGGVFFTATFEPLIKETYYHAVMTFKSGSVKLFLNTELAAEKAVTAGVIDTGVGESFIGLRTNETLPMNGRIDELAIYKTALSEARIKAHYKAGTE